MNWIKMAVSMKGDPSVHGIAKDCCKHDIAKAIGHLQCFFAELPAHARDGDLSTVDAMTVEQWALWSGKRGAFNEAVRKHLCEGGRLRSWEKYNGAAIRENDAARERMRLKREAEREEKNEPSPPERKGKRSPERSPNVPRTFPSDGTGRDVTAADAAVGAAAAATPDGLAERFVDARHREAYSAIRRSHRFPDQLDAMVAGLAEGLGAPRGRPLTWHQLGQGLLDLRAQQRDVTTFSLGAFAAKVPIEPVKPALELVRDDLPGTIRDTAGDVVWHPGMPADRPSDDDIAANGWSVAA
jgi:hypothetical protein